jgi:tetrahydromethanopterin S-methyltransferase subunit F
MSSISIKGIIVGNLFALATGMAVGFAVLIALAAPYEAGDFERAATLMGSGLGLVAGLALTSLIGIVAGFLSARVAQRGERINGALSGLFYIAYRIMCWPDEAGIYHVLDLAIAPMLGLFGGYLRLRQVRNARQ